MRIEFRQIFFEIGNLGDQEVYESVTLKCMLVAAELCITNEYIWLH
jgi:hypothetical protein